MSILNLNSPQNGIPRGRKATKILIGVGLLAAVLGFGSTFAANITLNNGNSPTEFGQGVQRTVYCGGVATTLTVKPFSTFKSSTNSFTVGGVTVSGIPAACNNMNFVLSVYKDANDSGDGSARMTIASTTGAGAVSLVTPTIFWTTDTTYRAFDSTKRTNSTDCQKKKGDSDSDKASTGGALLSLDTNSYQEPCKVAYLSSVTPGSKTTGSFTGAFTMAIVTTGTTLMSLADFDKITIETQNDTFGLAKVNGTGSGITNGLVNS